MRTIKSVKDLYQVRTDFEVMHDRRPQRPVPKLTV
jgi:hypothetical protein